MSSRAEHLKFCKDRAIKELETGTPNDAWSSMLSDMTKHEETATHPAIELGMMLSMTGHLSTAKQVREFILGFN